MIRAAIGLLAGFFLPLLALGTTSWVLGRAVLRGFRAFSGSLERNVVAIALGLGLMTHALLLLGVAGLLRPWPVLLLAAVIHAVGVPVWRELPGELRGVRPRPLWIAAALLGLAPLLLLPLFPPTAFDATLYHLPFARAFVRSGEVPFLPDLRFPVFPQANEILFAAAMLFGSDLAAQGLQLLMTLLTASLLVVWGRAAWPSWPLAGWLAAAVFLGNPIVVRLAGTCYVEPALALFVTASFFALDRWRDTGSKGWLALSALFGATAADVKYMGLFFLAAAGLIVLWVRAREARLFVGVAAAFLAPWYLRIYLHTGNPLFPHLPQVFGHSLWDSVSWTDEPLLARLMRWARLPWDVIFERGRYGQQPPFSPIYLGAIPLLIVSALRDPAVRRPLLIAGLYSFVFLWLPADSRYLVPVLPLASLAVAGSVAAVSERWSRLAPSRRLTAALCFACFLPGWLYAGYRVARQGMPPVTPQQREAYLARNLPAYPAIAFLNRRNGSAYTLWALHAENMAYFAQGRFLGDFFGPASFDRVLSTAHDPESLHRELRRLGATHLLIPAHSAVGQAVVSPVPEDAALRQWFELLYQDDGARLYALRSVARRGPDLRHQIRQVERRPEQEGEGELERQVEQVLAEAPEVAREGTVMSQAPGSEPHGIGGLHVEEDQEDVEEDGDQQSPAEARQPPAPGDPWHGQEQGAQHHQMEVDVRHSERMDQGLRRREVAPRHVGKVVVLAQQVGHVRALGQADEGLGAAKEKAVVDRRRKRPEQRDGEQPEQGVSDEEKGPAAARGLGRAHQVAGSAGGAAKRFAQ
jgi:uncharacterized membrane protein YhaH (DUF805 family)